jgi:hypothetical protein
MFSEQGTGFDNSRLTGCFQSVFIQSREGAIVGPPCRRNWKLRSLVDMAEYEELQGPFGREACYGANWNTPATPPLPSIVSGQFCYDGAWAATIARGFVDW